ncbi:divalent-cation tolerance protein CutA [Flexivirga oryzae]|uniref:Periplasmic divalent cation tolerance protein n=1 Tax=Flexivirga oryzae TaxID=1794944 RepID=A0A839N9Z5_9MICO|nr:divalent-cation tolerance protein CutA [Flexivirga oryzae]MBB2893013.1 periplasmic divalent cation tolerance protein [Flexivirga oryzae]
MTELIQVIVNGPPDAMPAIVEHVVKSRLAAAGHMARIESTYWWNGQLVHQPEVRATFNTTPAMFDAIKAEVARLHPYETPSIVAVPLHGAFESYVQWLNDVTKL